MMMIVRLFLVVAVLVFVGFSLDKAAGHLSGATVEMEAKTFAVPPIPGTTDRSPPPSGVRSST
jgi:hypothetical protein